MALRPLSIPSKNGGQEGQDRQKWSVLENKSATFGETDTVGHWNIVILEDWRIWKDLDVDLTQLHPCGGAGSSCAARHPRHRAQKPSIIDHKSTKIGSKITKMNSKIHQQTVKIHQNLVLGGSWAVLGPSWPQDGLESQKNVEK